MNNIVLTGMPGSGKSTCGVLLAKALGMDFADTDLIIQRNEEMTLQEIINTRGADYFAQAEEKAVCESEFSNCVIATGGSVVYSQKSMRHLADGGKIVYLKISFDTMLGRISNITTRGILLKNGETLEGMFRERQALYSRYADITVECDAQDIEQTVQAIINTL